MVGCLVGGLEEEGFPRIAALVFALCLGSNVKEATRATHCKTHFLGYLSDRILWRKEKL